MKKIIFLFLCGFILAEDEFMDLNGLMQYDNTEYIAQFKISVEKCNVDNADSCYLAGYYLYGGTGVKVDYEVANNFYDKACKLNDKDGCSSLALAYIFGIGVKKNFQIAEKYSKKACNLGNGLSCYYIGTEYETGDNLLKNIKTAKEYYKKACNLGHSDGCKSYARLTN